MPREEKNCISDECQRKGERKRQLEMNETKEARMESFFRQ
jgi:hypothetical protein